MEIVAIILLVLIGLSCVDSANGLEEIEKVVYELNYKHNVAIDLIDSLNRRIEVLEKERDETKGTS